MKKAFNYMFLDNKFYKKAAIFFIYTIILLYCSIFGCKGTISLNFLNYIMISLVILFGYSIFEGYKIAIIKALNDINESMPVLPTLNLKKDCILGIKYLISLLIFSIPFFCVIGAFGFTVGFASIMSMPNLLINISCISLILSILFYIIYLICFLPASILIYANTNSIWSFYKFEEIFKLISGNRKEYIKSALMYFIFGIVVEECYRICLYVSNKSLILLIIALFILACIITYLCFAMSYIIAKVSKRLNVNERTLRRWKAADK